MTKYHVVKCDNHDGWIKTGLAVGAVAILYADIKWTYERVLLPTLHIFGLVLVYVAITIGAITALGAVALVIVCLIERYRHGRSARSRRLASLPGSRLALQDSGLAPGRKTIEADSSLSARPLVFPPDIYYSDARSKYPPELLDKARQVIDSQDKTFLFLHGILPEDIDK